MKRPGLAPPPPLRPPEPPTGAQPSLIRLYSEAKRLYEERRYREALVAYEELASISPTVDGRVAIIIGDLHWWGMSQDGDRSRAQQWLEQAAHAGEKRSYLYLA